MLALSTRFPVVFWLTRRARGATGRLRGVRVLDPACGSGNFLIVARRALKDLEYEAIQWGSLVLRRSMQVPPGRLDDPWALAGAAVHISFIGQDDGSESHRELDGAPVARINPNLTTAFDLTKATKLVSNLRLGSRGDTKAGPFEIDSGTAWRFWGCRTRMVDPTAALFDH